MPKLGYLNLSRNALTDLPESIGDLEALGMLYLSHNALDSLPASIARMRKLKVLHVGSNKLSALPPGIDSLALSPPDTAGYSPAESFYYLDLSGNRLCGLSAAETAWADKLQRKGWLATQACGGEPALASVSRSP